MAERARVNQPNSDSSWDRGWCPPLPFVDGPTDRPCVVRLRFHTLCRLAVSFTPASMARIHVMYVYIHHTGGVLAASMLDMSWTMAFNSSMMYWMALWRLVPSAAVSMVPIFVFP